MKYLGITLFCFGVIVAVISSAKMPALGSDFPDTLFPFIVGTIIGIIGLVLWRVELRKEAKRSVIEATSGENSKNPLVILSDIITPLKKLSAELKELKEEDILVRVDEIIDSFITPFTDLREDIFNMMGMSKGAEVLVTVAYGERMLNRVWSATSDGCVDEACRVFPEVIHAYEEANKLVHKFEAEAEETK